jgi:hypothetical protein
MYGGGILHLFIALGSYISFGLYILQIFNPKHSQVVFVIGSSPEEHEVPNKDEPKNLQAKPPALRA